MKSVNVNCTNGIETIIDLTAEQVAEIEAQGIANSWEALRTERNARLAACDWTQTADAPVDKYSWAEYRQQLRDLPANTTDPAAPVWPTPPA